MQLQDATFDTAGRYDCEVTVPSLPGLLTSGSVHIIVQGKQKHIKYSKQTEKPLSGGSQCKINSRMFLNGQNVLQFLYL